jgi:energy-coupling factor transporter ATP-binding protein EcfA2
MIRLDRVTYTYPGTTKPALRDVSLHVPEGQFCAVVGPNNAGKSTLAYAMAGFIPHFYRGTLAGGVTIAGRETRQTPLHELVLIVGLIMQNPFNQISGTKFTVREEIAFGLENLGVPRERMVERVEEAMALVGIGDLAERSPLALSGGQMQRVAIASILAMQPKVLVLDEPTSQLDPIGSKEVFAVVRALITERKTTVVMIEHKLEWVAEFADRIVALKDGEIIADGEAGKVLGEDPRVIEAVGQTRYSQAGLRARQEGLWLAGRRLPVTLEEAVEGFREVRRRMEID